MATPLDKLAPTLGRDLYLPIGFGLSLRLEQVAWEELTGDPGLASFTLRSGQRLLGADGLVNWFDPWLESEAAGVSVARDASGAARADRAFLTELPAPETVIDGPTVSHVLDVTTRLCAESGETSAVLGYLTGGATLLSNTLGDEAASGILARLDGGDPTAGDVAIVDAAAKISVALGDAYCAAGVSALLLCEDRTLGAGGYLNAFAPLFNLADYYNVPVIFLARGGADPGQADLLKSHGVTRFVAADGVDGDLRAIPDDLFAGSAPAEPWIGGQTGVPGSRIFLSGWDLPVETRPETAGELSRVIIR